MGSETVMLRRCQRQGLSRAVPLPHSTVPAPKPPGPEAGPGTGALPRSLCGAAEDSGARVGQQIQGHGRGLGPGNYEVNAPRAFSILFACSPFRDPLSGGSLTPAKAGNRAMVTGRAAGPRRINGVGVRPGVRPPWSRCTLGNVVFLAPWPGALRQEQIDRYLRASVRNRTCIGWEVELFRTESTGKLSFRFHS